MGITRTSGRGQHEAAINKRTLQVIDRLAALKCDPIAGMARIAMDRKNPVELRGRMSRNLRNMSRRSGRRSNTPPNPG